MHSHCGSVEVRCKPVGPKVGEDMRIIIIIIIISCLKDSKQDTLLYLLLHMYILKPNDD